LCKKNCGKQICATNPTSTTTASTLTVSYGSLVQDYTNDFTHTAVITVEYKLQGNLLVNNRLTVASTAVFFNLFAAAEPYISVTITHGTPWHAMIRESNGVGKVKFFECLGTDVLKR